MLRSSRGGKVSRRIVIAVAAALVPLIAGCEAGNNAPTLNWHQPTPGSHATVGNIAISNVFVLGAPIGAVLRPGQNAGMFLGLVNTGSPDQLVSVSAPGVAQSVQIPGGVVPLRSQQAVLLTGPRPQVILEHLLKPLTGGSVITVFLRFAKAGTVKLQIPIMPRAQDYATLLPAPAPTRSHSARPTVSASASPKPSPTSSK